MTLSRIGRSETGPDGLVLLVEMGKEWTCA